MDSAAAESAFTVIFLILLFTDIPSARTSDILWYYTVLLIMWLKKKIELKSLLITCTCMLVKLMYIKENSIK